MYAVHYYTLLYKCLMWSIETELITGSLGAERRELSQSRELSKRLFIFPAGSWTAVSPIGTLQSGRHTGGQSRVSTLALEVVPAFWWRSGWHQEQTGLSRSREGDHTHKHTLPHSCWGANRGWQGGLLLKSCCCLEMAFMWMGALIGVVWQLSLHTEHQVVLFCWFLINKQCLKATMHLAGQHSDFLVALLLFVFESYSNSHWGDHICWEVLTFFINRFHSSKKTKPFSKVNLWCGFQLWYWKYVTAEMSTLLFPQTNSNYDQDNEVNCG